MYAAYDRKGINVENNLQDHQLIKFQILVLSETSFLPVTPTQMIAYTEFVSRQCFPL